jgi:hypothetical protein
MLASILSLEAPDRSNQDYGLSYPFVRESLVSTVGPVRPTLDARTCRQRSCIPADLQMSGSNDDSPPIPLVQTDNEPHILGLPTASSSLLAVLVRKPLLVQVDRPRSLDPESVCTVHDDQTMQLPSSFRIDRSVAR